MSLRFPKRLEPQLPQNANVPVSDFTKYLISLSPLSTWKSSYGTPASTENADPENFLH
jgi:hypothetical protein